MEEWGEKGRGERGGIKGLRGEMRETEDERGNGKRKGE